MNKIKPVWFFYPSSWDHLWSNNMLLYSLFLIRRRIHFLCFLLSLVYTWLSNNSLQQLLTIPSVCCYLWPPFLKNNRASYINFDFCFEMHLFLKYFKNNLKIFQKYFLIVIVKYILRISLYVTNPFRYINIFSTKI